MYFLWSFHDLTTPRIQFLIICGVPDPYVGSNWTKPANNIENIKNLLIQLQQYNDA